MKTVFALGWNVQGVGPNNVNRIFNRAESLSARSEKQTIPWSNLKSVRPNSVNSDRGDDVDCSDLITCFDCHDPGIHLDNGVFNLIC